MADIGCDSMPEQSVSRATRDGFSYNCMVIGHEGVGKTTLINSLFRIRFDTGGSTMETKQLATRTFDLKDMSMNLRLTITEANTTDGPDCHKPIVAHIDNQFEQYLRDELRLKKSKIMINDTRIHCCIYMISADGLVANDFVTMSHLHERVCLIPVIAKSDAMTAAQSELLKQNILNQLREQNISVFSPPFELDTSGDDCALNQSLLYAIVASDEGKNVRTRSYPWGSVDVEQQSDLPKLREMALHRMVALIATTNAVHYEKYRQKGLKEIPRPVLRQVEVE